ncbi:hypothetical protein T552_00395 [Pneumocystis carinii B80]|uniref:Ribosomal protein/NADH dehydrogenase domain-containing protein n=1 Tax=Pneumocystis carinii (strain B80) TaxID=1408658 RepID=A0A0W4ZQM6_PNEC8|nr:hypothetical protein T552_00395 [Pneumocystis carinii B80]KTW30682.1 hypothetical protein T552_00395 [Pneumocystis carinii B80]
MSRYILPKHIKELRFHMCQISEESKNARCVIFEGEKKGEYSRLFIRKAYPILKKSNPYVPVLIREAMGVSPMLWVRYEYGREENVSLEGLSEEECEKRVKLHLFGA